MYSLSDLKNLRPASMAGERSANTTVADIRMATAATIKGPRPVLLVSCAERPATPPIPTPFSGCWGTNFVHGGLILAGVIKIKLILENCDELMRLAGSSTLGHFKAAGIMRILRSGYALTAMRAERCTSLRTWGGDFAPHSSFYLKLVDWRGLGMPIIALHFVQTRGGASEFKGARSLNVEFLRFCRG